MVAAPRNPCRLVPVLGTISTSFISRILVKYNDEIYPRPISTVRDESLLEWRWKSPNLVRIQGVTSSKFCVRRAGMWVTNTLWFLTHINYRLKKSLIKTARSLKHLMEFGIKIFTICRTPRIRRGERIASCKFQVDVCSNISTFEFLEGVTNPIKTILALSLLSHIRDIQFAYIHWQRTILFLVLELLKWSLCSFVGLYSD